MTKYTLTYFNFRGRAELPRLLFAVADVDYEDVRVTDIEEWLKLKQTVPFGQLPTLKVDGTTICQSHAIARFLAREFDLAGRTSIDQARTDMVVDCVLDMMTPIDPCFREKDPVKQDEMRRSYNEVLPDFMRKIEQLLVDGEDYFVGDKLTWADMAVMNAWHWIPGFGVVVPFSKFPKLKAHKERIEAHPRVANWIERRPDTPV